MQDITKIVEPRSQNYNSTKTARVLLILEAAVARHKRGDLESAILLCKEARKIDPNNVVVLQLSGTFGFEAKQFDSALDFLSKAISLKPEYVDALYNRGVILGELRRFEEALKDYDRVILLNPLHIFALNNRADILKEFDRYEESLLDYNKAILYKPNYSKAIGNRANTLKEMNRYNEALVDYQKLISLNPKDGSAHRRISSIKTFHKKDEQFALMRDLVCSDTLPKNEKCEIYYALAKAYDDVGCLDRAFESLREGGRLRKEILSYDIEQDKELFEKIKEMAIQIVKIGTIKWEAVSVNPIFILGMPRSGTTLVEQIISAHPYVFGAGELPFWGDYGSRIIRGDIKLTDETVKKIRFEYLSELKKKLKKHYFITDKMPQNFRWIPLILCAFPEAKIINVHRSPEATCWSNFKEYFVSNGLGYSYDLKDVVEYYMLYEDLMRTWCEFFDGCIYNLNYESLTTDPEKEIKLLLDNIDLDWNDACLAPQDNKRFVKTASIQQVNKKIYKGSSEDWKKYEKFLSNVFSNF